MRSRPSHGACASSAGRARFDSALDSRRCATCFASTADPASTSRSRLWSADLDKARAALQSDDELRTPRHRQSDQTSLHRSRRSNVDAAKRTLAVTAPRSPYSRGTSDTTHSGARTFSPICCATGSTSNCGERNSTATARTCGSRTATRRFRSTGMPGHRSRRSSRRCRGSRAASRPMRSTSRSRGSRHSGSASSRRRRGTGR